MKRRPTFIYGIIAISISIILYILLHSLGFPDGYLTDLSKALKILYELMTGLYLVFALCFIYAAFSETVRNKFGNFLKYSFILSGIAVLIIYFFLMMYLDNGQGG